MRSLIRVPMLALLVVAATALAVEPPVVTVVPSPPAAKWQEFRAGVGQRIWLSVGKPAKWVLAEEGTDGDLVVPPNGGDPSFAGAKAGRYKIVAFIEGSDPARVVVVVGDSPAPPVSEELSKRYRDALALDEQAQQGTKATAARLADSYYDVADRLNSETDATAARLKTQADVFDFGLAKSTERQVPRPPFLANVRKVTGAEIGSADPAAAITDANRADLALKYRRAATALKEASK